MTSSDLPVHACAQLGLRLAYCFVCIAVCRLLVKSKPPYMAYSLFPPSVGYCSAHEYSWAYYIAMVRSIMGGESPVHVAYDMLSQAAAAATALLHAWMHGYSRPPTAPMDHPSSRRWDRHGDASLLHYAVLVAPIVFARPFDCLTCSFGECVMALTHGTCIMCI